MSGIQQRSQCQKVQTTLDGKITSEDWTFAKADTSYLTHGLHDYPARMIPQIAQRLIERYTPVGGRIIDPFCGGGTTLVEARLSNRFAFGNDINPLAILLSKVKTTSINFEKNQFDVFAFFTKIRSDYAELKKENKLPAAPTYIYHNLLHWFKEPVARDLQFIYEKLLEIKDDDIRDFLKVILSDTAFKTSNIDHRSSRFIRVFHEKELSQFNPDVFKHFQKKLIDSVLRMNQFSRKLRELNYQNNSVTIREVTHVICLMRNLIVRSHHLLTEKKRTQSVMRVGQNYRWHG